MRLKGLDPSWVHHLKVFMKESKGISLETPITMKCVQIALVQKCKFDAHIQGGMKLRKPSILVVSRVSSCLSFFLSASTAATYIFTAPNCTSTIISLEPCALNAEFQHFILRFHKIS
jgi:hypothetical protein